MFKLAIGVALLLFIIGIFFLYQAFKDVLNNE